MRELRKSVCDFFHHGLAKVGVLFQDVVAVENLRVNRPLDSQESLHNFFVELRDDRRLMLGFAGLVLFADALVDVGKFRVAVVLAQKGVV